MGARRPLPPDVWETWDDERLLSLRFRDLDVHIEGTELEGRIAELYGELEARGIGFRPHFWLSDEWFTPNGVPGIAIPFYLAHPRLARLELHQMLEVEGGTPEWCLRILRHEAGHAIENAYRLEVRRDRQDVFGPAHTPYPEHYTFRPFSKYFVVHLGSGYAQAHPAEDFAETFAVWLTPRSNWRRRYRSWPALAKLRWMDAAMAEIARRPPLLRTRRTVQPIESLNRTLRAHYEEKRRRHRVHLGEFYDRDLLRLFSAAPAHRRNRPAAHFIAAMRNDVRRVVRRWTGVYKYVVDQVLEEMMRRCRELDLRLRQPEAQTRLDFTVLLTAQTMSFLHSGRHRLAL